MKVKIIWMKEYADDDFHQHIAVDSGDWDEITEEEFNLLRAWSASLSKPYASAYPSIVSQDSVKIGERVLECKRAAALYAAKVEKERVDREKKKKEREKQKAAKKLAEEQRVYEELKKKFK